MAQSFAGAREPPAPPEPPEPRPPNSFRRAWPQVQMDELLQAKSGHKRNLLSHLCSLAKKEPEGLKELRRRGCDGSESTSSA